MTRWCAEAGLNYHIIDAEWKKNYLSAEELETLLAYSESLNPELKTIITISVRHFDSISRINNLMKLSKRHPNLGLNLVAGNKVYLTEREQKRPTINLLIKAIESARKNSENIPIFVGAEGLVSVVSKLVSDYEITPFLLLNRNLEAEINKIWEINNECCVAVYTPYLVFADRNDGSHEVVVRLLDYALRRRWIRENLLKDRYDPNQVHQLLGGRQENCRQIRCQKLKKTLVGMMRKISIFGNEKTVGQTLKTLKKVSIVGGLPIKEEKRQVKKFAAIIQGINRSS